MVWSSSPSISLSSRLPLSGQPLATSIRPLWAASFLSTIIVHGNPLYPYSVPRGGCVNEQASLIPVPAPRPFLQRLQHSAYPPFSFIEVTHSRVLSRVRTSSLHRPSLYTDPSPIAGSDIIAVAHTLAPPIRPSYFYYSGCTPDSNSDPAQRPLPRSVEATARNKHTSCGRHRYSRSRRLPPSPSKFNSTIKAR